MPKDISLLKGSDLIVTLCNNLFPLHLITTSIEFQYTSSEFQVKKLLDTDSHWEGITREAQEMLEIKQEQERNFYSLAYIPLLKKKNNNNSLT